MKIAIIGAGFTGIAAAWYLLQTPNTHSITLFDAQGIGGGASGIAAGLLHCFSGAHARLNRQGREGMIATSRLLKISEQTLGTPVSISSGFLRIALSEEQEKYFRATSEAYEDVEWWDAVKCSERIPGIPKRPGIFVHSAVTVYPRLYLQGLWLACKRLGAVFSKTSVRSLQELNTYDRIIVAAGASTLSFPELSHLPLTLVKGQLFELVWPEGYSPLPFPLNSQAYLVMNPDGKSCVAGASFEKQFITPNPDPETAAEEILPKVVTLYPPLTNAKILACRSGIRVSAPQHQPFIQQMNERLWITTGMGSKGLLYHALSASRLAQEL